MKVGHKSLLYFTRNLLVYGGEGIREKHMKVLSCSFGMAINMTNSANWTVSWGINHYIIHHDQPFLFHVVMEQCLVHGIGLGWTGQNRTWQLNLYWCWVSTWVGFVPSHNQISVHAYGTVSSSPICSPNTSDKSPSFGTTGTWFGHQWSSCKSLLNHW